jgi:hypothetical protein
VGDPFDFVAAYLIPEDIWYIIPAGKFQGQGSIALYPKLKKSKYGQYREAWHLLREKRSNEGRVDRIEACAEVFMDCEPAGVAELTASN